MTIYFSIAGAWVQLTVLQPLFAGAFVFFEITHGYYSDRKMLSLRRHHTGKITFIWRSPWTKPRSQSRRSGASSVADQA